MPLEKEAAALEMKQLLLRQPPTEEVLVVVEEELTVVELGVGTVAGTVVAETEVERGEGAMEGAGTVVAETEVERGEGVMEGAGTVVEVERGEGAMEGATVRETSDRPSEFRERRNQYKAWHRRETRLHRSGGRSLLMCLRRLCWH